MKLFLDDFRNPEHCFSYVKAFGIRPDVYAGQWEVVRSYDAFVKHITDYGLPSVISFDHDLSDEHYNVEAMGTREAYNLLYNDFREKTGFDAAKWLVKYCMDHKAMMPEFYCHSMNPVGRENINRYLTNYKTKLEQNDNKQTD